MEKLLPFMDYPRCPHCNKDTLLSTPAYHSGRSRWFRHRTFFFLWFKACRIQYLPHLHYHCDWCHVWHARLTYTARAEITR